MNKCGGVVCVLFGFLLVASAMVVIPASPADALTDSWETTWVDEVGYSFQMSYTALDIIQGANGFPMIASHEKSYYSQFPDKVSIRSCSNAACTSSVLTVIDEMDYWASNYSYQTSTGPLAYKAVAVTMGANGLPVVFYPARMYIGSFANSNMNKVYSGIKAYACTSADCSTGTATSLVETRNCTINRFDNGSDNLQATIGNDGLPVFAYGATGSSCSVTGDGYTAENTMALYKCAVADCSSGTFRAVGPYDNDNSNYIIGRSSRTAIGSDGFPWIASIRGTDGILLAKCSSLDCSSGTDLGLVIPRDNPNRVYSISMIIAADGLPVIAASTGEVFKCTAADCSTYSETDVGAAHGHNYSSYGHLALRTAPNGLPTVTYSYRDGSDLVNYGDVFTYQCTAADCSTSTVHTTANCEDVFTNVFATATNTCQSYGGANNLGSFLATYYDSAGELVTVGAGNSDRRLHLSYSGAGSGGGGGTPAGVTLSGTTATVSEAGTTGTFTVVLDAQPTSDVVISATSADTGEATVSPATLTFTNANWDTPQTVTITGVNDSLVDGNQTTNVTISVVDASSDDAYDSVADSTMTVTTSDDDTDAPTITVAPTTTVAPTVTVAPSTGTVSLSAVSSGNASSLVWAASDAGSVSSFSLAHRDPASGAFTTTNSFDGTTLDHLASGLGDGTHSFRILALYNDGSAVASNVATVTISGGEVTEIVIPTTIPPATTIPAATVSPTTTIPPAATTALPTTTPPTTTVSPTSTVPTTTVSPTTTIPPAATTALPTTTLPTTTVPAATTALPTTTVVNNNEETTEETDVALDLTRGDTKEPNDESSLPTAGLIAALAALAAATGLALTSAGQTLWRKITGFLAGSILGFLILGRKRNRCEHCNKLVTSKEGILVDEDDNYECDDNPDGDHHQLKEKQAQKNA